MYTLVEATCNTNVRECSTSVSHTNRRITIWWLLHCRQCVKTLKIIPTDERFVCRVGKLKYFVNH